MLIGVSAVAAGLVLLLLVGVGGAAAVWVVFNSSAPASPANVESDVASQFMAKRSSTTGPQAVSPAAAGRALPSGRPGELPPLPAGVGLAMTEVQPNLKYNWKVGAEYACSFSAKLKLGSEGRTIEGQTVYKPTSEDPSTIGAALTEQTGEGTGTAFVVHPQGVLVTCAHVVEGASEINVVIDGAPRPAKVIALDARKDLALLRIEASSLRYLPLADSDRVQLAEEIRAVGFPLTDVLGESIKVTAGEVSGVIDRSGSKLLQIDATVNPGNSGGPVVDSQGRVLGVASSLLAGSDIASMGFAVPANEVRNLLNKSSIPFSTNGAARPLAGTELASRVTPSVMLVKVKFGRGGVGSSQQQVVEFRGNFTSTADRNGIPAAGSYSSPVSDRGKLLISRFGEIGFHSGQGNLPPMMGQLGGMGIELLPSDDSRTWQALRVTAVTRVKKSSPSYDPYGGSIYSPYSRRRSGFAPPAPTTVELYPAIEQIDYELGAERGDTVEIKKTYRLTSMHEDGEPTYLDIQGQGTIQFDKVQGMPRRMDYSGTFSVSEGSVTVRLPFTMEYRFEDPEEFAKKTAEARARLQEAMEARRRAEEEKANQPPVRKIDAPAANTDTVRPSRPTAAPGGGLDKFDPNS
jgi:S1-C subfamily serine protease